MAGVFSKARCLLLFPLSQYGANNHRNLVFTKQGFNNWKTALEKDKGFTKQASSQCHLKSVVAWLQMKEREETGETTANLRPTEIKKCRYYIKSIGEIVKFLAVNELPLCGSLESIHDDQDASS